MQNEFKYGVVNDHSSLLFSNRLFHSMQTNKHTLMHTHTKWQIKCQMISSIGSHLFGDIADISVVASCSMYSLAVFWETKIPISFSCCVFMFVTLFFLPFFLSVVSLFVCLNGDVGVYLFVFMCACVLRVKITYTSPFNMEWRLELRYIIQAHHKWPH